VLPGAAGREVWLGVELCKGSAAVTRGYPGIRYCGQRYCGKGIVDNPTNKGIVVTKVL